MEKINNYKALTAKECAERILKIKNPICLMHVHPDGDTVGSASALAEIFKQLGEDCEIISADKIPQRLQFVLEATGVAEAKEISGKTPVAIDVASPSQLGALFDESNPPALMIDHHEIGIPFADNYIIPGASSAAEALVAVADELIEMGKIKLTEKLAYALYTAISSDTGCFRYSNATEYTHKTAARLILCGIDTADINHRLFVSKTISEIKAEGFIASKIQTTANQKCAYASLSLEEIKKLGLELSHFETAIDVIRSLRGAEIAIFVKEASPGKYKASLRSTGADVAKIAAFFGGGGHIRAAGCSPEASSIDDALKMIIEKVKEFI